VSKDWEFGISIDPGFVNPMAITLWATDYDGTVYCIDEHYESGKVISEHINGIREWYNKYPITVEYIDPSARAKTREKNGQLWSVLDEFMDAGINPIPANNDVLAGINRVNEYFKAGRIKIFKNCVNLIREIPEYQWQRLKPAQLGQVNEPEKPKKLNDHAVDSMRYYIMSRPDVPIIPEVKKTQVDIRPLYQEGEDMTEEDQEVYADL